MHRYLVLLSAILGGTGVALGAFGAHGLKSHLEGAVDAAKRLEWWETGARYHLYHALAIGLCAWLATRDSGLPPKLAAGSFTLGVILFSGSLYTMTWTNIRGLGAITPIGGLAFLFGWACVAWAGLRS
jgi:uncharacterized membrane protein YgdD (TMEM256/DUF423 family)